MKDIAIARCDTRRFDGVAGTVCSFTSVENTPNARRMTPGAGALAKEG
ncbi:MAG: hypothetical protein WAU88_03695 [Candidatus Zixiibacteriota bacterium]